ncbi:MAG: trypsin-like peptidase domain-containing protein [Thalassobaculales bacterium]
MTIRFRYPAAAALTGAFLAAALLLGDGGTVPRADARGLPLAAAGETRQVPSLAPMLAGVTPGVVNIGVSGRVAARPNPLLEDPMLRRFFNLPEGGPRERRFQSVGSGVIVDAARGYVLTNHHVIDKADDITVTLSDRRALKAKLIGSDPESDIAVLQIPADRLTAVAWGDSEALRVGDFVVAIGNPFGIGQTVTSGMVSALNRSGLGIEGVEDFIQTDASINPGNSGGALIDLDGRLVGINTAILGPAGQNAGIGFAVPVHIARRVFADIVEHGAVKRGRIGVAVQAVTPEIAAAIGLAEARGALVARVEPGSPAARAGLRQGDVVLSVDGQPVDGSAALSSRIKLLPPGSQAKLGVYRQGERFELAVGLDFSARTKG